MNEFSIIIRKVNKGKYETKNLNLQSNSDITKKEVRVKLINNYLKDNNYQKYCLCADCTLGPLDCPKIADICKKEIEKYPFIIEGFQVIDTYENEDEKDIKYFDSDLEDCEYLKEARKNSSNLETFVVSKCKKYSRYRTKKNKNNY